MQTYCWSSWISGTQREFLELAESQASASILVLRCASQWLTLPIYRSPSWEAHAPLLRWSFLEVCPCRDLLVGNDLNQDAPYLSLRCIRLTNLRIVEHWQASSLFCGRLTCEIKDAKVLTLSLSREEVFKEVDGYTFLRRKVCIYVWIKESVHLSLGAELGREFLLKDLDLLLLVTFKLHFKISNYISLNALIQLECLDDITNLRMNVNL